MAISLVIRDKWEEKKKKGPRQVLREISEGAHLWPSAKARKPNHTIPAAQVNRLFSQIAFFMRCINSLVFIVTLIV